jgi:peptide/nickel transport system permease protein
MQLETTPSDLTAAPARRRTPWRDTAAFIIGRKVLGALAVIYVVITLTFFLIRLMPGNAVDYLRAQLIQQGTMSIEQIDQQVRALYGIDVRQPVGIEYLQYMGNLLRGDLGRSILYPSQSVTTIIGHALPWTILIVASSLFISFAIGVLLGLIAAYKRTSTFSNVITLISAIFSAVPNYIVAILALYWLGDLAHVFPISGAYDASAPVGFNPAFVRSVAAHAVLPVFSYVITSFGGWMLAMKGSTSSVLGEDYIAAAVARGIPDHRVTTAYVGRNALLPMMTGLAISMGYMFGGAVFIETTFAYPGLGYYLVTATNGRDYPLMMGCFILIIVAVIVANLLTDIFYVKLDPRIKMQ